MSALLALGPAGLVLLVAVVVSLLFTRVESPRAGSPGLARAARWTTGWRLVGVACGIVAATVAANGPASWLGMGLALAAPAFTLCLLAGVLVGEASVAREPGATRTALIEVRSVRDYLPPVLTRWVGTLTGALAVLLIGAGWLGGADTLGRAGRSLNIDCGGGETLLASPWPGAFYGGPIAAAVAAGLVAAAVVLRRIVGRPRIGADPALRVQDDELRRRSSRVVMAACGLLVAVPLTGSAVLSGETLIGSACGPGWFPYAGWTMLGVGLISLVSIGAFGTALLPVARRVEPSTR
jgi:hypothetical protein